MNWLKADLFNEFSNLKKRNINSPFYFISFHLIHHTKFSPVVKDKLKSKRHLISNKMPTNQSCVCRTRINSLLSGLDWIKSQDNGN